MISGLFGVGTNTANLRAGLEEASATHRAIAANIAGASEASSTDFASQLAAKAGGPMSADDLERNMAALADTQLRYEAAARLLQRAYADFHSAIRNNG